LLSQETNEIAAAANRKIIKMEDVTAAVQRNTLQFEFLQTAFTTPVP